MASKTLTAIVSLPSLRHNNACTESYDVSALPDNGVNVMAVRHMIRNMERRFDERITEELDHMRRETAEWKQLVTDLTRTLNLLVGELNVVPSSPSLRASTALAGAEEGTPAGSRRSLRTVNKKEGTLAQTQKKVNKLTKRVLALETTSTSNLKLFDSLNEQIVSLVEQVSEIAAEQKEEKETVPSSALCGCDECEATSWNTQAPPGAGSDFTCGRRIQFLEGTGLSHPQACKAIGGISGEFPNECGGCDPDRCSGYSDTGGETGGGTGGGGKPPLLPETPIYCFPDYSQRKSWSNVWGEYRVEVKSNPGLCGPGNNKFTESTVSRNSNELSLRFQKNGGVWEGSEVRIVLPQNKMPYTYGTYKFSVKSAAVKEASGAVVANHLPKRLVLGMFTWDTTENYATHENWNHEVDIEISRWGKINNADGQFLIQPPGQPDEYRFFTGAGSSLNPGGHTYEFTWNPTSLEWKTTAGGGKTFTHTTQSAVQNGQQDDIQCLPANVEVRMNLWHTSGTARPEELTDSQYVEVVIDSFSFTPSNVDGVADGEVCSKSCQCSGSSTCVNNVCTA